MLISVHLPKTAGSSFLASLEENYGNNLLKDYADFPINTPLYERNRATTQASINNAEKDFQNIKCIHGHFLPLKYLLLSVKKETTFVTWMRNPVERILSHYYYWTRSYNPDTSATLHKRVVEERWSLERFCLAPELRNLYSQFLYGFPLENFSFIGITENYDEDFQYFSKYYLNVPSKPKKINIGNKNAYDIEKKMRSSIESYHSKDMFLYKRALEASHKRLLKNSYNKPYCP